MNIDQPNATPSQDARRGRRVGSTLAALLAFAATALFASAGVAASAFTQVDGASIPQIGQRIAAPVAETTFRLDLPALSRDLATAPLVRSDDNRPTPVIELPLADGSTAAFRVYDSPVMAPALAARYPEIRTYEAYGVDDTSLFARFSITPFGFHGLIFTPAGSVWIDPYQTGDVTHYSACRKLDYRRATAHAGQGCELVALPEVEAEIQTLMREAEDGSGRGGTTTGDELRTYRTCVAATGEYTTFHGGTVPLGQAAIVVAMNRVNGIYQREACVFMELIANNDDVVYTSGGTDPYTNNNGSAMLSQNQSNLTTVIGSANYDHGHVFSTGGGGIASLGSVCVASRKAQGVTGLPSPVGDVFYVDYVSHEMGHQFGANHSFNGVLSACAGNRSATHAYEPGSGTTIMSYAGICGADNIAFTSDDYFHVDSFEQIRTLIESGAGTTCGTIDLTGNNPPTANGDQGAAYSIPTSTPFKLTGSGSDADGGDVLTYCWEQFDLGPAGSPNSPTGNAPLFRSFDPVAVNYRIFPKMSDIVNNVQIKGEILPSYARNMKFRLTVRDQLGGVAWDQSETFAVVAGGPFLVTQPNVAGISYLGGSSQTVTWNVAGTNALPVNCQTVNILLSQDGGFTYPHTLATAEANDGSASVIMPLIETTTARVKVEAADNIFFDISNVNFEISGSAASTPDGEIAIDGRMLVGNEPNPFDGLTSISFRTQTEGPVSLMVYDATGRAVATLANGTLAAGSHTRTWNGRDDDDRSVAAGVYFYRLEADGKVETRQMVRLD